MHGQCPDTTSNTMHMVICTGNYTHILNNRAQCLFAVQTVAFYCDATAGNLSPAVNVVLSVVSHGSGAITQSEQCFNSTQGLETQHMTIMIMVITFRGMATVIIAITVSFIMVTMALIRSRRALREKLKLIFSKQKQIHKLCIYEEIFQDLSSPII